VSRQPAVLPSHRLAVELIEFVERDAEFMADLTTAFLDVIGIVPPLKERLRNPVALPSEFLLELAAILRIALWERAGLVDRIGHGMPSAEAALADLFGRLGPEPQASRSEITGTALCLAVFRTTVSRLAWGAREELYADVVLDPLDDGSPDALADFLWSHRDLGRSQE
jgi:hypothetical protein